MKVDFKDIPEGKTFRDYPPDTIFVLSEYSKRYVDLKTGNIIREYSTESEEKSSKSKSEEE